MKETQGNNRGWSVHDLCKLEWEKGHPVDVGNADFDREKDPRLVYYTAYCPTIREYITATAALTHKDYVRDPAEGLYLLLVADPIGGEWERQFHTLGAAAHFLGRMLDFEVEFIDSDKYGEADVVRKDVTMPRVLDFVFDDTSFPIALMEKMVAVLKAAGHTRMSLYLDTMNGELDNVDIVNIAGEPGRKPPVWHQDI